MNKSSHSLSAFSQAHRLRMSVPSFFRPQNVQYSAIPTARGALRNRILRITVFHEFVALKISAGVVAMQAPKEIEPNAAYNFQRFAL